MVNGDVLWMYLPTEYARKQKQEAFRRAQTAARIVAVILTVVGIAMIAGCSDANAAPVNTEYAVIHHTASGEVSAAEIARWHRARGFDGIGYHFVIHRDGTVEKGRSLSRTGAHAKTGKPYSRNNYVGIVLTGTDTFTQEQVAAVKKLVQKLGTRHVERHHEECPGSGIDVEAIQAWIDGQRPAVVTTAPVRVDHQESKNEGSVIQVIQPVQVGTIYFSK